MGARFSASKTATAMVANQDILTITAPSTRAIKILEVDFDGGGTASAANEIIIQRSTGGATPVAVTPVPLASGYAAAAATVASGWTTHPTLTSNTVLDRIGINSNGAKARKVYPPGQELEIPPSGQISIRPASGTGIVTATIFWEEVG